MKYKLILPVEQRVTRWSGGETRELYIAPENSSYAGRDFELRLSTATVETRTSDFTPLPDYQRILLLLEGKISLHHSSDAGIGLTPYAQYSFDGGIATKSHGTCRDFNVMVRKGTGTMPVVQAIEKFPVRIKQGKSTFLYAYGTKLQIHCENLAIAVPQGSLVCLYDHPEARLQADGLGACIMVQF
ncbi:MAG: HutD family protein [Anaerovibrio sp.]|nr:HutD family protein [Selenomonadaceae bacterium]MDD6397749.1 HutD family protein [Selenomonadaceae bacterium]MDY6054001.1 HutD family protein [Anaerovibrio sp.]